ncbi:ABC-type multidrug transport system fused ATPase/permease subunit [Deinobacterium chartae]|uniref:ABC-type multidrug transport system fused ATPase/permease subunit n=1 Tax=Deinobacterium chartae TaxID=521158 RepID=A0A841I4G8_9DEIO|nr:ABC transporter ATP-binding protein [Deinobacterium chartae]MBB6099934.1 ABC-type multidrug transport system fused ATPase/permease subunit [Deinobacterium chartae]
MNRVHTGFWPVQTAWRARVGAVFQDFGHYALSVRENVALGDLSALADPARLEGALRAADFNTSALPQGPDTLLGKAFGGTELSGGQWQKLAIARAFLRRADLLVLDEPTAALDPRSEHALYRHFARLATGRTTLLITHRLASVQMADRILVLRGGCLAEQGSHTELLQLGGEYAQLYRLQAEQYAQGDPE